MKNCTREERRRMRRSAIEAVVFFALLFVLIPGMSALTEAML